MTYRPPQALRSEHELEGFSYGSADQTLWLHRHARQSGSTGTTKVLVVTTHESLNVVAYYAWCMAQVAARPR